MIYRDQAFSPPYDLAPFPTLSRQLARLAMEDTGRLRKRDNLLGEDVGEEQIRQERLVLYKSFNALCSPLYCSPFCVSPNLLLPLLVFLLSGCTVRMSSILVFFPYLLFPGGGARPPPRAR